MCLDAGWLTYDVPVKHANFGGLVRCTCRTDSDEAKRWALARELSGLSGEMARHQFSTFRLREDEGGSFADAADACARWSMSPRDWLLLTGPAGTGKTHLASAIANRVLHLGGRPVMCVVPHLVAMLRRSQGEHDQERRRHDDSRWDALLDASMLVLDDLGAERSTPFAVEQLYDLVNWRYNQRAPTVITTNCRLEDMDGRIASRLRDRGLVTELALVGEDYRPRNRPGGVAS